MLNIDIKEVMGGEIMKLSKIKEILGAEVLTGEELLDKVDVKAACGADLMSDVLAFTKEKTLLLTGLTNAQVIRTAEISDLVAVVFVRGKRPSAEVIQLAREQGIPLLFTTHPLYETCGLLYGAGLPGCSEVT